MATYARAHVLDTDPRHSRGAAPHVITATPRSLRAVTLEYGATEYVGWEVVLPVQRVIQPV